MSPEEFRRSISLLWGYGAQAQAARHWSVADRTIRRFVSGEQKVPEPIAHDLRAMIGIMPPPGTDADVDADTATRDEACADAIEPALTALRDRCMTAGWNPAEIAVAIVSLGLSEIVANAGPDAALAFLDEAKAAILGRVAADAGAR